MTASEKEVQRQRELFRALEIKHLGGKKLSETLLEQLQSDLLDLTKKKRRLAEELREAGDVIQWLVTYIELQSQKGGKSET